MNSYQRAAQIWTLLVCAARERKDYTYGGLGKILGLKRPAHHWSGKITAPIADYCAKHGLPPLTVLVVREKTGKPGAGWQGPKDISRARADVFKHDWFAEPQPRPRDFRRASPTKR